LLGKFDDKKLGMKLDNALGGIDGFSLGELLG